MSEADRRVFGFVAAIDDKEMLHREGGVVFQRQAVFGRGAGEKIRSGNESVVIDEMLAFPAQNIPRSAAAQPHSTDCYERSLRRLACGVQPGAIGKIGDLDLL